MFFAGFLLTIVLAIGQPLLHAQPNNPPIANTSQSTSQTISQTSPLLGNLVLSLHLDKNLNNWWNVVNWEEINRRLQASSQQQN
ncbi:hypothetical protein [Scytonema millei]|uniref:Uncharacterized protein n=1 Tax=Scytonema millei VB511283 TaxID=1245923 RepID=A0A9X5E3Y4_9CYAN|nr:hypothetical protein [Scytonema millei]NHC34686.1 hypothetical protein [Scytonema millei VB511283]